MLIARIKKRDETMNSVYEHAHYFFTQRGLDLNQNFYREKKYYKKKPENYVFTE